MSRATCAGGRGSGRTTPTDVPPSACTARARVARVQRVHTPTIITRRGRAPPCRCRGWAGPKSGWHPADLVGAAAITVGPHRFGWDTVLAGMLRNAPRAPASRPRGSSARRDAGTGWRPCGARPPLPFPWGMAEFWTSQCSGHVTRARVGAPASRFVPVRSRNFVGWPTSCNIELAH